MKFLLEFGAKVDLLGRNGDQTPSGEAAVHGNYEMVETFLEAGADPRLAKVRNRSLIRWFEMRDERFVGRESQVPWYRKAREILVKQGHLMKWVLSSPWLRKSLISTLCR